MAGGIEGTKAGGAGEVAMFAAGCFWGVEEEFRGVKGVLATEVGYAGGTVEGATYQQVCGGKTGHAEVVRVTFDPGVVSYRELVDVFWSMHDPTTLNRQGPDVGTQYRSAVFVFDDAQRRVAEESRNAASESGRFTRPIVTEITPAGIYAKAEEYHQQYFAKRGGGSCHL